MRVKQPALRQSCTAYNAYNASLAIYSVLSATLIRKSATRHSHTSSVVRNGEQKGPSQDGRDATKSILTAPGVGEESLQAARSKESPVDLAGAERRYDTSSSSQPIPVRRHKSRSRNSIHAPVQIPRDSSKDAKSTPPSKPLLVAWKLSMQKLAERAGEFAKIRVKLSDTNVIEERRASLNYDGLCIPSQPSPLESRQPVPWALHESKFDGKSAEDQLEHEVQRFVDFIEPTSIERVARQTVISQLRELIVNVFGPDGKSEIFGSERTGLAVSTSDVDIRVELADAVIGQGSKERVVESRMRKLADAMYRDPNYMLVVPRYGTYPIINAQHQESGILVQVTASGTTAPQDAATKQYLEHLPHLRSLYVLLRAALGIRGLVDVFSGGTGSYGLFMMLVASIERRSSNPPVSLVDQLFNFLEFYIKLDYDKYGVSVSPPKLFKKHDPWDVPTKKFVDAARRRGDLVRSAQWAISQRRLYQPYLLCLQDPAKPSNDLGRKSNAIKHIVATLTEMRANLLSDMERAGDKFATRRKPRERASILLRFVGRCHEVNIEQRRKLEEYGLKVMQARTQNMAHASPAKMFQTAQAQGG